MKGQVRKVLAERLALSIPARAVMLTTFEVARILRVTRWTLLSWRRAGKGPCFAKLARNTVRYPRAGFERWLCQHIQGQGASSDGGTK
jgi:hypothetical protein